MPSTYTLNNGIELIATGEQSGTWGDTTNTNFELLDTSLDGQVTVTLASTGSSGSPNTLPVSDGAASNGRNRLVIFDDSSDLGGTAFVQLTPSDAEKIIYVRNSLSGSRSILLFQGTYNASNDYEVPAGTTAVVFFNGAGAGAVAANVFNNAHFDNLNVVGDVTIGDDLTLNSDGAIINIGADNDLQITHSGTAGTITNATGDLTLDVAGDIILDGDGADVKFRDGGAGFFTITNSSLDAVLKVEQSNEDFIIKGNDGGVEITALTLDMSAAGAATFNAGVTLSGDLTVDTDTLYVDSTNNRVGIGASSPEQLLEVRGNDEVARFRGSDNEFLDIQANDGGRVDLDANNATGFSFSINTSPAVVIDGSRRVLIGKESTTAVGSSASASLQISQNKTVLNTVFDAYGDNAGGSTIAFGSSRSSTVGTPGTIVQNNDNIGAIRFAADDGTDLQTQAALIVADVDGTPGANDMPGRLEFHTTADGASSATERMRINSSGDVGINVTSDTTTALDVMNASADTNQRALNLRYNGGMTSGANEVQLTFSNANPDSFQLARIASSYEGGTYMGSLRFYTNSNNDGASLTEAMRIDQSQRVMVGVTSNIPVVNASLQFEVIGDSNTSGAGGIAAARFGGGSTLALGGSPRSTTTGSYVIVQDDDNLGNIFFSGDDGTDLRSVAARISADVDGTPGANDMPGRLVFYTTSDGGTAATERMQINSAGDVSIGGSAPTTVFDINVERSIGTTIRLYGSNNSGAQTLYESFNGLDFRVGIENSAGSLGFGSAAYDRYLFSEGSFPITFSTNSTEAMRIDSSQQVLINLTTAYDDIQSLAEGSNTPVMLQVGTAGSGESAAAFINNHNSAGGYGGNLTLGRVKSTRTVLSSDMQLGAIHFNGDDGTNIVQSAAIQAYVDGSPSGGDMPGRISFRTALDGTDTLTEHMRINNSGQIYQYAGIVRAQNFAYVSMSNGTASATLVSNMDNIITGTYGMCKILMHGNENAATNASARQYIVLKRTGGFEITEIGTGITYGNTNGHVTLSINVSDALIATRAGTGGTGNCMVSFEVLYR